MQEIIIQLNGPGILRAERKSGMDQDGNSRQGRHGKNGRVAILIILKHTHSW